MKIDVYDTYARSGAGRTIHFDVLLPSGGDQKTALKHAHAYLRSIGEDVSSLKSDRCNFCHSETAHPLVESEIKKTGHYILKMEGCPDPS